MRVQVVSDLHLEFGDWTPPDVGADVVVLAGDIHTKGRGVKWAQSKFSVPVVMVAGNHDYYQGSLGRTCKKMQEQAHGTNVHFLHDSEVVIDGVRFLGGTLWTDYRLTGNEPLARWDAEQQMADFKQIRDAQFRRLHTPKLSEAHFRTREFLAARLDVPFEGKTVVVTHHAPCELSIAPQYLRAGSHLSAAYASRLDRLMGPNVALWAHGHTHHTFDYDVYGTRVVCNPRGYAPDDFNEDFDGSFVVEV